MLKLRKKSNDEAPEKDKAEERGPQGISAEGNALKKICIVALLVIMVPLLLGFTYLILLRDPGLQTQQLNRIASSYALQQATNMHRLFTRLEERVQNAAQSPLALSAIASKASGDINLVEKALLDFFPEVISLRFIPIGDLGTADFSGGGSGLRNHIEMDLVRLASEGEEPQPEAYRFEDSWLTSLASKVSHPRLADRTAVILVTIDNEQIATQLKALEKASGRFALEHVMMTAADTERVSVIAFSGSATPGPATRYANVPGTPWRVSFTPSQELIGALSIDQIPILALLVLLIVAAIASIALILRQFPKALEEQINLVIAAADKKTSLSLDIPELVTLAKQLRRATLRILRQGHAPAAEIPTAMVEDLSLQPHAQSQDMANPMFQSGSILDQDEEPLDLDLSEEKQKPAPEPEQLLPEHIFRAYDIRGSAQTDLTDEVIGKIGQAVGSIAGEMGEQALIVACDGRLSSPRIKSSLVRAIMESGRDVIDIGVVPTPLMYFATRHLECRSGVMITGSHNPPGDNGLKIVLQQQTIASGGIQQVRDRIVTGDFTSGIGRMTREDVVPAYLEEVLHDIAIAVPLKIVVDAGNGATSEIAPRLFEELGCEVERLYCEIDGNFPNHSPDTSNEDNLADLCRAVQEHNADFGVAFDGDGDRLAVVTGKGNIIRSDVLLMLFAQDVVSRNPGADVVFDVKCSRNLSKLITRHGGRPVLWKTGHAFMKEKMRETGALLGGEFSGHMFFGERWYGFDDGMYAAARLAEILSTHGETLDDCIEEFPTSVNTPEIIIPVPDDYKFALIDKIARTADFTSGKINTMDGVRVDFSNGWGLIRASNTVAALTARFEADDQENLELIQDEFRAQIALADPEIELKF
jgi:phosphomannomutase/phosphoglucomutase